MFDLYIVLESELNGVFFQCCGMWLPIPFIREDVGYIMLYR